MVICISLKSNCITYCTAMLVWIALMITILACGKASSRKCFETQPYEDVERLGDVFISCQQNFITLSWQLKKADNIIGYQIEYQCYSYNFSQSNNVIVRHFYNLSVNSPVSVTGVSGTECSVFGCVELNTRGVRVIEFESRSCLLNANQVAASVPIITSLSHLSPSSSELFSSTITAEYSLDPKTSVTSISHMATTNATIVPTNRPTADINKFTDYANIIVPSVIALVISLAIGITLIIATCICLSIKKPRRHMLDFEVIEKVDIFRSISLVRASSEISIKTDVANPVNVHLHVTRQIENCSGETEEETSLSEPTYYGSSGNESPDSIKKPTDTTTSSSDSSLDQLTSEVDSGLSTTESENGYLQCKVPGIFPRPAVPINSGYIYASEIRL